MINISKSRRIIAALCGFLTSAEVGNAAEDVQWFAYPEGGVSLGQGFDLLTGAPTPASCLNFVANYDNGLDTKISFTEINSFVDTMSSMKISGSGKLKLALLDASASVSIANESHVTKTFKYVGVNARVFLGASYVAPVRDRKYPPEGETSSVGSDDEAPAITFTDAALNAWPGLSDEATGAHVSAYTICGSGYVSSIVRGVELNAILDTENSSYVDGAEFSGQLKTRILAGVAKLQADARGTSSAKTQFEQIRVNARIVGKKNYAIPLNGIELNKFITELPKDLEDSARPILIAVTPYENLYPQAKGAYATASDFTELIDAWFIAREARTRLLAAIEEFGDRNASTRVGFLEKSLMHDLVEKTYAIERAIREELQGLVSEEEKANQTAAQDTAEKSDSQSDSGDGRAVIRDMLAARSARLARAEAEAAALIRAIDRETLGPF